jgi:hypothetical protein
MHTSKRALLASVALTAATVAGLALPGGGGVAGAALPNVSIVRQGGMAVFSPSTITVAWSGPTSQTCDATLESLTLVNATKVDHEIFGFPHVKLGILQAGVSSGLCFFGSGTATYIYSLHDGATLTVNVQGGCAVNAVRRDGPAC